MASVESAEDPAPRAVSGRPFLRSERRTAADAAEAAFAHAATAKECTIDGHKVVE